MKKPPRGTVLEQRIQDGEQLAHAGDEGHLLLGLAGCQQPLIELTDGRIETGSHQSTHVQSRPHPRSSAPHRPTAAQSAGVAVQGSHADQGGQALSVECAQLGKLGQQRPRQYRTHPRHAPEQGFVLTPCSAPLDRLVQIAYDALKFPLQPPHVRLDALLHRFARRGAEAVSFGGYHAHDLWRLRASTSPKARTSLSGRGLGSGPTAWPKRASTSASSRSVLASFPVARAK